jgi:hypothetical protein
MEGANTAPERTRIGVDRFLGYAKNTIDGKLEYVLIEIGRICPFMTGPPQRISR